MGGQFNQQVEVFMIKAIQTVYKNYKFRSRLEARWGVFFDALGLEWQYEPEGFDLGDAGLYLPDFYLPFCDAWAEVKPQKLNEVEREKAFALSSFTNKPVIELCQIPDPDLTRDTGCIFASRYYGMECEYINEVGIGLVDFYMEENNLKEGCLKDAIKWDADYYQKKYGKPHPLHFKTGAISKNTEMRLSNVSKLYKAAIKARQARFEHGEKP